MSSATSTGAMRPSTYPTAADGSYTVDVATVDNRPVVEGLAGALTVGELLDHQTLEGAQLIAGASGVDRLIRRLNVMTVPDIVRWTKEDEFLLTTGYPLPRDPATFCELVLQLAGNGLAGLGIKLDEYLAEVPSIVVEQAELTGFPLVLIPSTTALDDVLSAAFKTIVNRQAAALAQTQEIHDTFLGVVLSGGGLAMLVDKLSVILQGAEVVISDTAGNIMAATEDLSDIDALKLRNADGALDISQLVSGLQRPEVGPPTAAAVIRAGAMRHGFVLAVAGARGFPFVAGPAVDQAALVGALEITRGIALSSVKRQFASNALHDLVTSGPADVDDAAIRAQTFGWNLQGTLTVLVSRYDVEPLSPHESNHHREIAAASAIARWTSAIQARDDGAAAAGFATEFVAVVSIENPESLARAVQAELISASHSAQSLGFSRSSDNVADIPRLYQEARTALAVGRRLNGDGAVTGFSGLGLHRLLSNVDGNELRLFAEESLGPVLSLSDPIRTDFLATLSMLVNNRFNVALSARALHYHYNTMRYRISRLEKLLGPFVGDPEASLRISVALQILRMHEYSLPD